MTWAKKLKPGLAHNVTVSNVAFQYILENRLSKHEPIYRIIDRIILDHKQFVQSRNISNGLL